MIQLISATANYSCICSQECAYEKWYPELDCNNHDLSSFIFKQKARTIAEKVKLNKFCRLINGVKTRNNQYYRCEQEDNNEEDGKDLLIKKIDDTSGSIK